jgi:hypothetical protein
MVILLLNPASGVEENNELKSAFMDVDRTFPKHAAYFFYSLDQDVIDRYKGAHKGVLPAAVIVSKVSDDAKSIKKARTHSLTNKLSILDPKKLASWAFRYTCALVERLPGDGGLEHEARLQMIMRSNLPRVMVFATDERVPQKLIDAVKPFRDMALTILLDMANPESMAMFESLFRSDSRLQTDPGSQKVSHKDSLKLGKVALKNGETVFIFVDPLADWYAPVFTLDGGIKMVAEWARGRRPRPSLQIVEKGGKKGVQPGSSPGARARGMPSKNRPNQRQSDKYPSGGPSGGPGGEERGGERRKRRKSQHKKKKATVNSADAWKTDGDSMPGMPFKKPKKTKKTKVTQRSYEDL